MEKLLNIVQNFKNPTILVVGDIILDEYIWGKTRRISREGPVPVLEAEKTSFVAGGAANTAHNLKVLGGRVFLTGVVGPDEKGEILRKNLAEKNIGTEGIFIEENRKTTVKSRLIAQEQQPQKLFCLDMEDKHPINSETENKIFEFIKERIGQIDTIIINDASNGVATPTLAENIIKLANEHQVKCLVDFKGGDDYLKYKNCALIAPNEKELALTLNLFEIKNESQFFQAGTALLSFLSCDRVLVKQAEKGMTLFEKDGRVLRYPAVNKNALDVSGAGDTAIAALALALSAGADVQQALILASHAAGIAVAKFGTAVVSPQELEESLKNNSNYERRED